MTALPRRRLLAGASAALGVTMVGGAPAGAAPAATAAPVTVRPDDPRYPELVTGNNQRWVARPGYVVLPTSTAQVVAAVQAAVDAGRRIAVRSGGHCYEDFVYHRNAQVVIDLSEFRDIDFDPHFRSISVAPGATLLEVYRTLFRRWGVTIPGGSCYSVGAGGHIVGGGYGFLSRRHGLTVDHLYGVEVVVVDAAGRARSVVATRDDANNDLWWAHTGGGGGNFGIVTRYLLRSPDATGTDPASALPRPPSTVLLRASGLDWASLNEDRFVRLVANYGRWHEANSAPGSPATALSAVLALNHLSAGGNALLAQVAGDARDAAGLLDGFFAAVLDGVVDPARAAEPTAPLGHLGPMPALAQPRHWPWLHATSYLGTNTPALTDPLQRGAHKAAYLRRALPEQSSQVLYRQLTEAGPANPRAGVVLFSHGGRVNAVAPSATAVAQRDSVLKLLVQSFWSEAADDGPQIGWVRETYGQLFAQSGGVPVPNDLTDGCYINYPDGDLGDDRWNRSGLGWQTLYYKDNYPRLQRVKARWDPADVFRHAQSVRLPGRA
ncbi:FAD-binding oxidoreductase [Micromonospora sp. NPDC093277]|uniref:FAD-binding oxidoreductase n=1 Tax=Micromonospora sp. NPDC093277 TaxID=3364291 RepID=UPI00381770A1